MRDVADGVLTESELRAKVQEIHTDAEIASMSVYSASRDMLAAVTTGDVVAFGDSIEAMDRACRYAGR